jgi:DNA primase
MNADSGYNNVTAEELLDHHGVDYRRTSGSRGPQLNLRECPACGGSQHKVFLSVETGLGNCFHGSCGKTFNLWTFAAALTGFDKRQTAQMFDEIASMSGWKPKKKKVEPAPVFDGELKFPVSVPVNKTTGSISYLDTRGISIEECVSFQLRICRDGVFNYKDEDGADKKSTFSGRIIIPIFDLSGKLVTFQGRDYTGMAERKYLFPPRLPSTARFLYNGQRAFAEKWEHVVMGEGAFDVIAIQKAIDIAGDIMNAGAIGSFGKKLTLDATLGQNTQLNDLIALKANGTKRITILWDGEKGALHSAAVAAHKLKSYGFEMYIGFLPQGCDPAEVDTAAVQHAIRRALPFTRSLEMKIKLRNPYK